MPKDRSFHDYVVYDLFRNIPEITSKAMFGGWGIYKDGIIFAILADSQLYFKVDDCNRSDFKKLGSQPFVYSQGDHKPTTMSYWLLPEEIIGDSKKLTWWVERSVEASKRKKKER